MKRTLLSYLTALLLCLALLPAEARGAEPCPHDAWSWEADGETFTGTCEGCGLERTVTAEKRASGRTLSVLLTGDGEPEDAFVFSWQKYRDEDCTLPEGESASGRGFAAGEPGYYQCTVSLGGASAVLTFAMEESRAAAPRADVALTVTGVEEENALYDGQPHSGYTGVPAAEGYEGTFTPVYFDANGDPLDAPPVDAGTYTVGFQAEAGFTCDLRLDFEIFHAVCPDPLLSVDRETAANGDSVTVTVQNYRELTAGGYAVTLTCGNATEQEHRDGIWSFELSDPDTAYYVFDAKCVRSDGNPSYFPSSSHCAVLIPNETALTVAHDPTKVYGNTEILPAHNVIRVEAASDGAEIKGIDLADSTRRDPPLLIFQGGKALTAESVNASVDYGQIRVEGGTKLTVDYIGCGSSASQSGKITVTGPGSVLEIGDQASCNYLILQNGGEVISHKPFFLNNTHTLTLGPKTAFTITSEDEDESVLMLGGDNSKLSNRAAFDEAIRDLIAGGALSNQYPAGEYNGSYMLLDENDRPVRNLTLYGEGHPNRPTDTPDPPEPPDPPAPPEDPEDPEQPTRPVLPPSVPGNSSTSSNSSSSSRGWSGHSRLSGSFWITVKKVPGGKVEADRVRAYPGTLVTLTVHPEGGCALSSLKAVDSRKEDVELIRQGDAYTFRMPARDVTVTPAFEASCDGGAGCPSRAFSDLDPSAWYHEATDYVLRKGVMGGYGGGLFGPNDPLTRGHLVQALYNLAGRPAVTGGTGFSDVPEGLWCADAAAWAAKQGIASGYAGGRFLPGGSLSREQRAVMLWRWAGSPAPGSSALPFSDGDAAGDYAREALAWAAERGILSGKGGGILDPKGPATRAQAARMLKSFAEAVL